ncbi:MAG: polymer-forming cytoskeletal protein [Syntrophorhabdus sp.]
MADENKAPASLDEHTITTVIAEDLHIKGTIRFKSSVMLKGSFEGEIYSNGLLVVGPHAHVDAGIETLILVSHGEINGNVKANGQVTLSSTSVHNGDIATPNIYIENGSTFNGSCTMRAKDIAVG